VPDGVAADVGRYRVCVRALLVSVITLTVAAAATFASASAAAPSPHVTALSNEVTTTTWAHPLLRGVVRVAPDARARRIVRLHLLTEEGWPEVYLVLAEAVEPGGQQWLRIRIPGRPNGRIGWVMRQDLGRLRVTDMALRINLRSLRATLLRDGRPIWRTPIGAGKRSTPTPPGHFWIRELMRVPGDSLYGPYAFGTSDYSTLSEWPNGGVVGIHGTNEPWLIPGRPSHGCIRMRNPAITFLAHHLPIGAPVDIFR